MKNAVEVLRKGGPAEWVRRAVARAHPGIVTLVRNNRGGALLYLSPADLRKAGLRPGHRFGRKSSLMV